MTATKQIKLKTDKKKLVFQYLPGYASFLLQNHLDDFVKELLIISREEKIPILEYFKSYSEEELFEMGKVANQDFLTKASQNKLMEVIENSTRTWRENRLPLLERDQVLVQDITLVSFVRRKGFRKFLVRYTEDIELMFNIMEEIDHFIIANETSAFNTYLEIQKEKLKDANFVLALREEELLEAQILANMGSFVWDLKGMKTSFTHQVTKIFGIEQFVDPSSFMENVHPEDKERVRKSIDDALKGGGIFECEYRYEKNGEKKVIWSRGKVMFKGKEAVMMKGTVMDITQLNSLIQNLNESEERYHNMVEEIQDYAIIALDKNGIILNWNKGAEKIKGYRMEEIVGKKFDIFYSKKDRENNLPDALLAQAVEFGKATMEGWRIRKDGTRFWGSTVITALHDGSNNVIGFSKITRDLTERKLAEDRSQKYTFELESKNRELESINKELESFNYMASHDLQEPLRKIQAYSNRLLNEKSNNLTPPSIVYLEKINSASTRMQNLIGDLLAFAETASYSENHKPTDLNELLMECKDMLADSIEEANASIKSTPLPVINVVPFQFQQVFINILDNAIKYRKENVSPEIAITSTRVRGSDFIKHGALPGKDYLMITFADNGIGFEAKYNTLVFEIFQRLHGRNQYSGSGVGLAICKKIINNHDGFIIVESEPGIGSQFQLFLPADSIVLPITAIPARKVGPGKI